MVADITHEVRDGIRLDQFRGSWAAARYVQRIAWGRKGEDDDEATEETHRGCEGQPF